MLIRFLSIAAFQAEAAFANNHWQGQAVENRAPAQAVAGWIGYMPGRVRSLLSIDSLRNPMGEKHSPLDSRHKYCGKHGKMVVIPDTFVS
ncbi:MAG: hypothetical protein WBW48_06280 [Anaerolineae bacterium]